MNCKKRKNQKCLWKHVLQRSNRQLPSTLTKIAPLLRLSHITPISKTDYPPLRFCIRKSADWLTMTSRAVKSLKWRRGGSASSWRRRTQRNAAKQQASWRRTTSKIYGGKVMKILSCEFSIDTACVELKLTDGTIISIDRIAVRTK